MRGATLARHRQLVIQRISTHTPHAGRDTFGHGSHEVAEISTHTPHAGRDHFGFLVLPGHWISTHTPHAGRDVMLKRLGANMSISTHTPHAGRDVKKWNDVGELRNFNSHAPCGARHSTTSFGSWSLIFQLTRPMRGATMTGATSWVDKFISTHTPHAGRDKFAVSLMFGIVDFNSHAPCGARLSAGTIRTANITFQLTRPMRGATAVDAQRFFDFYISTHTPHAGRDVSPSFQADTVWTFQLTRPMRGATLALKRSGSDESHFNSHAPCGARLVHACKPLISLIYFNSHAPCGARRLGNHLLRAALFISTHTPHAGRDSHVPSNSKP